MWTASFRSTDANGNAGDVDLIAHNSAGTSANCGMVAIAEQLLELERMGRENSLVGAASLNARVRIEFERIRRFLEENFGAVGNAVKNKGTFTQRHKGD